MVLPMKTKILTKDREIYDKFNLLNFTNEILLPIKLSRQVKKIVGNANKNDKILDITAINDYFVIKRIKPAIFNVYFTKKTSRRYL